MVILMLMNVPRALHGFHVFGIFYGSRSKAFCLLGSNQPSALRMFPSAVAMRSLGSVHSLFIFYVCNEVFERGLQRDNMSRLRLPGVSEEKFFCLKNHLKIETMRWLRSLPAMSSHSKHPRRRQMSPNAFSTRDSSELRNSKMLHLKPPRL